jgi:hypothetical protein
MMAMNFKLVAALSVLMLTGCAPINPYPRASMLERPIGSPEPCPSFGNTAYDAATCTPTMPLSSTPKYAGNVELAIAAINEQRNQYYKSMEIEAGVTSLVGTGMIALSADAIYKGLTQSAGGRLVPREAALFGGLYAAGTWYDMKQSEAAYALGFQALTCTLLRSRALMMEQDSYILFSNDIGALQAQMQSLEMDLAQLQVLWDLGEEDLRPVKTAPSSGTSGPKSAKDTAKPDAAASSANDNVIDADNLKREIGNTIAALQRARTVNERSNTLRRRVDDTGFSLQEEANMIVSQINTQLAKASPDISALQTLGTTFSSSASPAIDPLTSLKIPSDATFTITSGAHGTATKTQHPKPATQQEHGSTADSFYPDRVYLRKKIAAKVELLYATALRLNSVLYSMHDVYRQTRVLPECAPADGSTPLAISPSSMAESALPGDVLTFHVSGGSGIPSVTTSGNTGASSSGTSPLNNSLVGGTVSSVVTIPKSASGKLTLTATDQSKPAQTVSVDIDVEGAVPDDGPPSVTAVPSDKSVKLNFSTPAQTGGTLTGYYLDVSDNAGNEYVFLFKKPGQGTTANSGKINANISSVSNGKTSLEIDGLDASKTYSMSLTATFSAAADVSFSPSKGVALVTVKPQPPSRKVSDIYRVDAGLDSVDLNFETPAARPGKLLLGYEVKIFDDKSVDEISLVFNDWKANTTATSSESKISSTITTVDSTLSSINIKGLENNIVYAVSLYANYSDTSLATLHTWPAVHTKANPTFACGTLGRTISMTFPTPKKKPDSYVLTMTASSGTPITVNLTKVKETVMSNNNTTSANIISSSPRSTVIEVDGIPSDKDYKCELDAATGTHKAPIQNVQIEEAKAG